MLRKLLHDLISAEKVLLEGIFRNSALGLIRYASLKLLRGIEMV